MSQLFLIYILHVFNDGFKSTFILLLPFIAKDIHLSLSQVGLLGTLAYSTEFLLAIPAGYLATKYNGLKILLLAFLLYGVVYIGTSFSFSFWLLLIMFLLGGIGYGVFHAIAFGLVARNSTKENRGKIMGNFTAVGDIGKVAIQACITFIIVAIGWKQVSLGIGTAITAMFVMFYFLHFKKTIVQDTSNKKISWNVLEILKNRHFMLANLANLFDSFASSALYIFLPFLLLKRSVDPAFLGPFTAVFFVGNLLGKATFGRLTDKLGNKPSFVLAEIGMALFIFLLANTGNVVLLLAYSIILGIFTKGTSPILQTFITDAVHEDHIEKAFGIAGVFGPTGSMLAPLFLGFISDRLGIFSAFEVMAGFALLATIPAFLFRYVKK